jgi:phosphate-selective porin
LKDINELLIDEFKERYVAEFSRRDMLQCKVEEHKDIDKNNSYDLHSLKFYERELELSNRLLDGYANEVMQRLCGLKKEIKKGD